MVGCTTPAEQPAQNNQIDGGSDSEEVVPAPSVEISAEQKAALADGVAETSEYQEGFRRFQACLLEEGYELRDITEDQYGFINAGIPDAAVKSGLNEKCYEHQWKFLDIDWQMAHSDHSPSTEAMRSCLLAEGITPKENADDVTQQFKDAALSFDECG